MIRYIKGNILESNAQALVNTVNTVGVMGKGIALQFKKAFPLNYKLYKKACKNKEIDIGKLFVTKEETLNGEKIIINFPTKTDWRKPSEYEYIEKGLDNLIKIIKELKIKSIALPPLGSGNGGLVWENVKRIIEEKLKDIDIDIFIYEPTKDIIEKLKTERVKLTPGRAMLLYMFYELIKNGEFVSEFSAEKICYFLQKFGGKKFLNLQFKPYFYGPYSGKVKYVLYHLNGSYITGYSAMNKKPFEPIFIIPDGYNDVISFIESNPELKKIVTTTSEFLNGFYSDFALELLSSIDWIIQEKRILDVNGIKKELESWNKRKRSKFSNVEYIETCLNHIKNFQNEQNNFLNF